MLCGPIKGAASSVEVADLGKACEYQPKQGFAGVDTFNYVLRQATDQLEKLVPVTVVVTDPNDAPVFRAKIAMWVSARTTTPRR